MQALEECPGRPGGLQDMQALEECPERPGGLQDMQALEETASMLSCRHEKFSLPKILPRKPRKPDKKGFALVEGGGESHKAPKSFPGKMGAPWHFKSKPLIPVYSLTA